MSWIFGNVRFPYPNMQELNLDWIMEHIANLEKQMTDLAGKVDPEYVDGEIAKLQNEIDQLKYFQRLYTSTTGWNVMLDADGYLTATRVATIPAGSMTWSAAGALYQSSTQYVDLPFPCEGIGVGAVCDRGVFISNVAQVTNGVGLSYRIMATSTSSSAHYVRFSITSKVRVPVSDPTITPNATAGAEIVAIAQTYIDARDNGRRFSYGPNFFYSNSNVINTGNGRARMECDTFVGMCLRGIPYGKSPYVNDTPDFEYPYNDLYTDVSGATIWQTNTAYSIGDIVTFSGLSKYWKCIEAHTSGADFDITKWRSIWIANPDNYAWSSSIGLHPADNLIKRDIKYGGDVAMKGWRSNCIFSNPLKVADGDVAVWCRRIHSETSSGVFAEGDAFDNVTHVGLVSVEDGIPYVYHVTVPTLTDGEVLFKQRMDSFFTPPTYFCRFL